MPRLPDQELQKAMKYNFRKPFFFSQLKELSPTQESKSEL